MRSTRSRAFVAGLMALLAAATPVRVVAAQQPADTARVRADTTRAPASDTSGAQTPDTAGPRPELRPPLSPRRAFLYSLLLPGYAQSILGRGRAGTLQVAFEAVTLIMIRQSAANVREARHNVADSIPVSFVDANGNRITRFERTDFPTSLVKSRRAQLEDWIAVLLANHLFSAADGYVAALLWDLPAEIAVSAAPHTAALALRVRW